MVHQSIGRNCDFKAWVFCLGRRANCESRAAVVPLGPDSSFWFASFPAGLSGALEAMPPAVGGAGDSAAARSGTARTYTMLAEAFDGCLSCSFVLPL